MTVSLKLKRSLYLCPANWNNFIKDLRQRGVEICDQEGFAVDTLNRELALFKARYTNQLRVDFENEQCYTMFVLKYGVE